MADDIQYIISLKDLFSKSIENADKHAEHFEETLEGVKKKIEGITAVVGIGLGVRESIEFGKEIENVSAEFEGFQNRIKFASTDQIDASTNIKFIRQEVERLHLPMKQVNEGFSEMEAGLVGTGIEGKRLRDLFDGISTAAATLHLPTYQLQRTLYDLKEIGEIGLNARIGKSLSTALPGFGDIVRETFGKSFHELEGHITGPEFLQKLGPALTARFESGLDAWGDSLQAKMNDRSNAITSTMIEMGDNLKPVFLEIETSIEGALKSDSLQWFVKNMHEIISVVGTGIEVFAIYKGILLANTILTKTLAYDGKVLTLSLGGTTTMIEGTTVAVEGLSSAFATLGLGAIAFGIAEIVNQFSDMATKLEEIDENMYHLQKYKKSGNQIYEDATQDYKDLMQVKATGGANKNMLNRGYNNVLEHIELAQKEIFGAQMDYTSAVKKSEELLGKMSVFEGVGLEETKHRAEIGGLFSPKANELESDFLRLQNIIPGLSSTMSQSVKNLNSLHTYAGAYRQMGATGNIKYTTPPPGEDQEDKKSKTRAEGQKIQTFNIQIGDLIKEFTIATTNLSEAPAKVREVIVQALTSAVNDSQHAAGM